MSAKNAHRQHAIHACIWGCLSHDLQEPNTSGRQAAILRPFKLLIQPFPPGHQSNYQPHNIGYKKFPPLSRKLIWFSVKETHLWGICFWPLKIASKTWPNADSGKPAGFLGRSGPGHPPPPRSIRCNLLRPPATTTQDHVHFRFKRFQRVERMRIGNK